MDIAWEIESIFLKYVQSPGLEISGRKSYFETINFILTTMTVNVVINLTPDFST